MTRDEFEFIIESITKQKTRCIAEMIDKDNSDHEQGLYESKFEAFTLMENIIYTAIIHTKKIKITEED